MTETGMLFDNAPYQLMPPLSDDEYANLKDSIAEKGVLVPIIFDERGNVIDGHHRLRICEELGITDYPTITRDNLTEQEKRSESRLLNLHRRHLSQAQKRDLIAQELLENPSRSNNQIAKRLGVSDMTVAAVRRDLGDDATPSTVVGADGKLYPAKRGNENPGGFLDGLINNNHDNTGEVGDVDGPEQPKVALQTSDLVYEKSPQELIKLQFAVEPSDRDVVLRALNHIKEKKQFSLQVDALLWLCNQYLAAYTD